MRIWKISASQTIPAVHKCIAVVQYISDRSEPVSVKELSYALAIPMASCYRLVCTLVEQNWLREDPGEGLRIAFGLAHVARAYSELETRLRELEGPLRRLANDLSMSAKITLREGHYAVTVLRAEPPSLNAITSPIGYRFHLAIGSASAVLLAQMEEGDVDRILASAPDDAWQRQSVADVWKCIKDCKETGACSNLGLQHPSIHAVSVPLRLTESQAVALTAVGWPEDFGSSKMKAMIQSLKRGAESMQSLGVDGARLNRRL